ncbi:MAG: hypothetical protein E7345_01230 [Clostridiales bacterium]|nr:hypothetical protein [Clostridiales bacterium]
MKNNYEERLKNVLISDKKENPEKIKKIIKAEILYLMRNYFTIDSEDLNVDIIVSDSNKYKVDINFTSNTILSAKTF